MNLIAIDILQNDISIYERLYNGDEYSEPVESYAKKIERYDYAIRQLEELQETVRVLQNENLKLNVKLNNKE